jgi:hypothetical protein
MKNSMANVYVIGASITAVFAISLATTAVEEDDAILLKCAQELFKPLPWTGHNRCPMS